MSDNSRYLNALVDNDEKTIGEIYKKNYPKIKKYILYKNGQEADAEDIFQRVLLQISVRYRREKFEIKSDFDGFIFVACKNSWNREIKKRSKRVTIQLSEGLKDDAIDQSLELLEQERWEVFMEGMAKLSENCQKVLQLFFAKTPYSTIVEKFGYNSETVARQRVFKCKAKLKETIKNDTRYNSLREL